MLKIGREAWLKGRQGAPVAPLAEHASAAPCSVARSPTLQARMQDGEWGRTFTRKFPIFFLCRKPSWGFHCISLHRCGCHCCVIAQVTRDQTGMYHHPQAWWAGTGQGYGRKPAALTGEPWGPPRPAPPTLMSTGPPAKHHGLGLGCFQSTSTERQNQTCLFC